MEQKKLKLGHILPNWGYKLEKVPHINKLPTMREQVCEFEKA